MNEPMAQPTPNIPSSFGIDPSRLWVVGIADEREGRVARSAHRLESRWDRCECPDDCPRDHGNE